MEKRFIKSNQDLEKEPTIEPQLPNELDRLIKEKNIALQSQNKFESNYMYWAGFYKKPFKDRLQQLKKMDPDLIIENFETGGLTLSHAELMVENCIGKVSLPLGLGLNFLINGKYFTVPMCVEEPSIIAASSSSAKFIAENGNGFVTFSTKAIMIGQIQILDCDPVYETYKIMQKKTEIIERSNIFCQNMVERGGGVIDLKCKTLTPPNNEKIKFDGNANILVVELFVDVCESMGANIINTILENITPFIQSIISGRVGIRILSNLCSERKAISKFSIPIEKMKWKETSGKIVAARILEAYRFAQMDPYRATTHNKGIMNGIDSVAIATGQDWRAIESSCHAYSYLKYGSYQPLSSYEISINNGEEYFSGTLELPIAVGIKGGVLASNPLYNTSLRMLDFPNAQFLSEIMVSVGLAQNFGALRALAIEGIQKGHMALHAKNIAMAVGSPTHLVEDVVNYMKTFNRISIDSAKIYLQAHEMFTNLRMHQIEEKRKNPLSTFYVKIKLGNAVEPIIIHIAFDCWTDVPIHYSIEKKKAKVSSYAPNLGNKIFGEHDFDWLSNLFYLLDEVKINNEKEMILNPTNTHNYKIKLLSILLNVISFNLMKINLDKVKFLFENIQMELRINNLFDAKEILKNMEIEAKYGMSLFCELYRVFIYTVNSGTKNEIIRHSLINEMNLIIESNFNCHKMWAESLNGLFNFEDFLRARKKRLCASMMLMGDLSDWKVVGVEENNINSIKILGTFIEIIGIVAHDMKKWKENKDFNLFVYYKLMKKEKFDDNFKNFLEEIDRILTKKKELISQIIKKDIKFQNLLEKAILILKEYYNMESIDFLKKTKL